MFKEIITEETASHKLLFEKRWGNSVKIFYSELILLMI